MEEDLLICEKCSRLYDEDDFEFKTWKGACICDGDLTKAVKCGVCGDYFPEKQREHLPCVCPDCAGAYAVREENMVKFGEDLPEKVKINALVTFILTTEEINKILLEHIKDKLNDDTLVKFANSDKYAYYSWLSDNHEDLKGYMTAEEVHAFFGKKGTNCGGE